MPNNSKDTSLLYYGFNYDRKKFYDTGPRFLMQRHYRRGHWKAGPVSFNLLQS